MFVNLGWRSLFVAFIAIWFVGCQNGKGYKTKSGLIFYVYGDKNRDSSLAIGSVLKMNVKKYVNDSLVKNTYQDRKSTRLNSSHVASSYAVFCLTKTIS